MLSRIEKLISEKLDVRLNGKMPSAEQLWNDLSTEGALNGDEFMPPTEEPPKTPNDTPGQNKPETPSGGSTIRSKGDLEKILTDLSKDIDNSIFRSNTAVNTITGSELSNNIKNMTTSSNPEVAGIGKVLTDLFKSLGVEVPEFSNDSGLNSLIKLYDENSMSVDIIMKVLFAAIKGEEIDSSKNDQIALKDVGDGLTIDDLMALDKNGDGSIVDELKTLVNDPKFIEKCKLMITREKNRVSNATQIDKLDTSKDAIINVGEIAAQFGENDIADLFKNADGTVDRALIIALGGKKSEDGNYTITKNQLKNTIYLMDADGDGKITKEEVEKFKQTQWYKKAAYDTMMSEAEKSNDSDNRYDGLISWDDIESFKNNPLATPEQKDFFSVINNITDVNLKKYIMEAIGKGNAVPSVDEFTAVIDSNGDGIVSKEELQKYVDFVTQFYNIDNASKKDRLLDKNEAMKIEPFKSNPDIWHSFNLNNGCVKLEDIWDYIKTNKK